MLQHCFRDFQCSIAKSSSITFFYKPLGTLISEKTWNFCKSFSVKAEMIQEKNLM